MMTMFIIAIFFYIFSVTLLDKLYRKRIDELNREIKKYKRMLYLRIEEDDFEQYVAI